MSKGGFLGGSCLLGQLKKKRVTSGGPGPLFDHRGYPPALSSRAPSFVRPLKVPHVTSAYGKTLDVCECPSENAV